MFESEEAKLRIIVDKHLTEMFGEIVTQGVYLGAWPRDTGAITNVVVEIMKHQYRTTEERA